MLKKNYKQTRELLIASLLKAFPHEEVDEFAAVTSHWLQSPNEEVPFLTSPMRSCCLDLLRTANKQKRRANNLRESGELYQVQLPIDWADVPFPPVTKPKFKFIDLFAGIGGFRIAMQEQDGKCVFSSEWNLHAKETYAANFGEIPYGDIRKINENTIPDHDVLCAGFPCQPFSLAGVSARNALNTAHGFACETQGTLFFDIVRILKVKRPRIAFLENVKNIVGHDSGKTFSIIKNTIESLGYSFSYSLIDASPLVPQKRVRCYMVCVRDESKDFDFPKIKGKPLALKSVLEKIVDSSFTISPKLWEGHQRRTKRNLARGTGFTAFCADLDKPSNTIVARYGKDGKECLIPQSNKPPRMLTPRECARLQGFPESFIIPTSRQRAYRQFGNSVAVPVLREIALAITQKLSEPES